FGAVVSTRYDSKDRPVPWRPAVPCPRSPPLPAPASWLSRITKNIGHTTQKPYRAHHARKAGGIIAACIFAQYWRTPHETHGQGRSCRRLLFCRNRRQRRRTVQD